MKYPSRWRNYLELNYTTWTVVTSLSKEENSRDSYLQFKLSLSMSRNTWYVIRILVEMPVFIIEMG